jgi:UTP--glucose-1-phosphate uridylyltransferase
MRPFSDLVPKELVPLGATPALELVLAEAWDAGLSEVVLVVAPGKELVVEAARRWIVRSGASIEVNVVEQPEPLGLGHALLCCREAVGGEPFALLLPDNVVLGRSKLPRMLDFHRRTGLDVVGVLALDHRHDGEYGHSGLFEGDRLGRDAFRIRRLCEKRPGRLRIGLGERIHRTCGRYVCAADVLDWIAASKATAVEGELSEVPAYTAIAEARGLIGVVLPPPVVDVGYPAGVLAGSAWLDRRRRSKRGTAGDVRA